MRSSALKKFCVRWNEDLLENCINVLDAERKRRRLIRDDEVKLDGKQLKKSV